MVFWQKLERWYDEFGRTLPWRGIDNPYYIWLSEVILQQTRIEQGKEYYFRFIDRFPTVEALAEASEEQVLKEWQGLGYYSRARNLHAAAKYVATACKGKFPDTYSGLLELKGVGRYSAAAIASFAFRLPHPVIDGNVYRFISRLYGISTPVSTVAAYDEFEGLLLKLMDKDRPDVFNAAMMDFGSLQCKPLPDCSVCPFQSECLALSTSRVHALPVKLTKQRPTPRWFHYLDIRCEGRILLRQRVGKDIWKGLWDFPLIESEQEIPSSQVGVLASQYVEEEMGVPGVRFCHVADAVHKLTHRTIHASFWKAEIAARPRRLPENVRALRLNEIKKIPVPRLIDRYLQRL